MLNLSMTLMSLQKDFPLIILQLISVIMSVMDGDIKRITRQSCVHGRRYDNVIPRIACISAV